MGGDCVAGRKQDGRIRHRAGEQPAGELQGSGGSRAMNEVAGPMHSRARTARCAGQRHRQRLRLRAVTTREDGLVLLALLIALMLMSIALAGALDVWSLERQREQERQLLF